MENLQERAVKAAKTSLVNKGYEIVGSTERGPVAIDEDCLVFTSVLVRVMGSSDGFATDMSSRKQRELEACMWLAEHPDYTMPIRFDEVSLLVLGDDRAMLRHHINCLSSVEVA